MMTEYFLHMNMEEIFHLVMRLYLEKALVYPFQDVGYNNNAGSVRRYYGLKTADVILAL